jgi:hypothetical protein
MPVAVCGLHEFSSVLVVTEKAITVMSYILLSMAIREKR